MKGWKEDEIVLLNKLLFDGLTYEEIGVKLDRSYRSIKEKCSKLGLSFYKISKIINYENIECLECGEEFKDLKNSNRKFCSKSCSVTYNNKNREIDYDKIKKANCIECGVGLEINIRSSSKKCKCKDCKKRNKEKYDRKYHIKFKNKKIKKIKPKIIRFCKKCNKNELKPKKQYCEECMYDYYHLYRPKCDFKFSLNEYPDRFNFDLIEKYGWYSPTNKNNNLDGVSRDHIYSVRDGFENGISPDIISHPANCQLLIHSKNNTKNKYSEITIEKLLEKIKKW